MAEFFDALNEDHKAFIGKQPMFFVATAAADGRINLSPKGYDAFRVLGADRVAYLDLAGSGNETHAHMVAGQSDKGRVTIMFNNFENPALIMRLYGKGKPVLPQDDGWAALAEHFEILPGTRQIFDIQLDSVQTSCGWGVPRMELVNERETLVKYHRQSDPDAWLDKTAGRVKSIDGLATRATDRYFGVSE
ncbi:pyridoxamine 5'-phosphate oxidase family protein [Parasphingorhabdus halotolerans]|uniref:Pyridoxamine 5'-phosphate oxidase family protein n=1 Tax=Parasphingorhabdus halotolerans TaxID=2725558 RepID=A0A6H2DMB3_9SPHN|nr:pyridoxamine 5'-phosphate oxidase family protein [Parasphingorhabdus halotolerans]QJB69095.1 pyridoxamine 5'-phosphate oxidase family protein [Parasphingorhabdus halotolerans]